MDYSDTETSAATTNVSSLINPKIWNYGEAGYDHTHILRIYWNYNLPRASNLVHSKIVAGVFDNWQISGIYTAQSGAPLAVTYAYSPTQDIVGTSTDTGRPIISGQPRAAEGSAQLQRGLQHRGVFRAAARAVRSSQRTVHLLGNEANTPSADPASTIGICRSSRTCP